MITDTIRRIFSVLLTLIIVYSLTTALIPVNFADIVTAKDVSGGAVPEKYYPPKDLISSVNEWTVSDGSISSVTSNSDGTFLRLSSDSDTAGAELVLSDGYNCTSYKETGIYLRLIGEYNYTVTLTADHNAGKSSFSKEISAGKEYYIFTNLPDNASYITKISFTAKLTDTEKNNNKAKASVILRGASVSKDDHCGNMSRYSAFDITGLDKDNSAHEGTSVTAGPIITDMTGKDVAVRVFLSGRSGGVTFSYAEDGENYSVQGSSVITDGRSCYIFTVDNIKDGAFYSIDFTGVKDNTVSVSGVDIIPTNNTKTTSNPCTISKNIYNAESGTLNITGSVARDTVIKYIDRSICLYEFSLWQSDFDPILAADPIDTVDMSTAFSFSVSVSKERFPFCAYIIALNDNGAVYPLSDPIYPTVGAGHLGINRTNSLYGSTPDDAFTHGYDNYVIDVDISELFLEKSSGNTSVFTHDGHSYYINKGITSDITKNTKFLSAAGVGVIFNILLGDDINPRNESDCRTVAASVAYLYQEYLPFGFRVNGIADNSSSSDLSNDAYKESAIIRLCYAASKGKSVIYTDIDTSADGESLAWFLARYTKNLSVSNVEFILTGASSAKLDAVADCAADGGYSYGLTVMTEHGDMAVSRTSDNMNVGRTVSYIHRFIHDFTDIAPQNSWEYFTASDNGIHDPGNSIDLWNFTKSYSTGGLTPSPESEGVFTVTNYYLEDFTGISSCRSVKTVLDRTAPVLIIEPVSPMMLTNAPLVRFLIQCNSGSSFSLEFIFISGKDRAVFSAEYDGSGIFTPVCDLTDSDVSDKIDRIAIRLKNGDNADLNIANISAEGTVPLNDAADTVYMTEPEGVDDSPEIEADGATDKKAILYASFGVIALTTIIVFAVLSIRKS